MLFIFAPCKITENLLFSIDQLINIRYIVFIAQNLKLTELICSFTEAKYV
jgi:hypothetical protein